MHIHSGFVSGQINSAAAIVSVVALAYSLWKTRGDFARDNALPALFAMVSSFVFAAQMLNFPIGGGTSGHFLGAVLATALLGPWMGCLSMALVLSVQSLVFADGGLMALGTNHLNMGLVAGLAVYPFLQTLRSRLPATKAGQMLAVGLVSWLSVVLASLACALELALSGVASASAVVPAMVGMHALIGMGEATITVTALAAYTALSDKDETRRASVGFVLAVVLAALVSPFASAFPDGLEKVAMDQGFISAARDTFGLLPDYRISGVSGEALSTGLAGLIGTSVAFAVSILSGRLISRR